jgi:hypothetical protein
VARRFSATVTVRPALTHPCSPGILSPGGWRWPSTLVFFPNRSETVADCGARFLGTTWEQLRPNSGENGGVGPTRKQDESTKIDVPALSAKPPSPVQIRAAPPIASC